MEEQAKQLQKWWQQIGARFRSWWQKMKQHPYATGIVVILVLVLILFFFSAYRFGWDWSGFDSGTSQITITSTSKGNYTATIAQPSKTLWDWLQLLGVLAIPVVVGFGAVWFTTRQGKVSDAENKDNQREAALQVYIDKMSELLLHEGLRGSEPEDEVRTIARVRTMTVLRGLDSNRKASVLQFLYESGLIEKGKRIVDLSEADLSSAYLFYIKLSGADLSLVKLTKANLFHANLTGANLTLAVLTAADLGEANLNGANLEKAFLDGGADLSFADLSGANLRGAILKGTNLLGTKVTSEQLDEATFFEGVTVPDGSIHP